MIPSHDTTPAQWPAPVNYNPPDYGARRYDVFLGATRRRYKVEGSSYRTVRPSRRVETTERRYVTVHTPATNGRRARETIVTPSTGKWIHLTNLFAYQRHRPVPAAGPHYSKLAAEVCPICSHPHPTLPRAPPGSTRNEFWSSDAQYHEMSCDDLPTLKTQRHDVDKNRGILQSRRLEMLSINWCPSSEDQDQ